MLRVLGSTSSSVLRVLTAGNQSCCYDESAGNPAAVMRVLGVLLLY